MKTINVVKGPQNVPAIIQGCMRMPALSVAEAARVIRNAWDRTSPLASTCRKA